MIERQKKKVVLFYGKFYDDRPYDWLPYNILYLAAPLVSAGFEPILITEFVDPEYVHIIKEHAEDSIVLGISAMTGRQITSGLKAAQIFREYAPKTPIVWGGAHPTAIPNQTIKHELVDIVCVGPSEISFLQLVSAIRDEDDLRHIPSLMLEIDGRPQYTGRPTLMDLSKLPRFPFHILQIEKYINPKTRVLNYTASCGCPGACSFCSWGGPHPWRHLPIKRILDDIEWLLHTYKLQTIWFSDADLFSNKEFVLKICEGIQERQLDIYWRANSRVRDLIKFSGDEMKILEQSGLDCIFLGIEATTKRMMKLMYKVFKIEDVDAIVERTKGLSIEFYVSFIFGSPTETIDDLEASYYHLRRWQSKNKNVKFQTCIYTPYPGTPMTDIAIAHGLRVPDTLDGWGRFSLVNDTRDIWYDRPWYSEKFNREYGQRFKELFPSYPRFTYKEVKSYE